MSDTFKRVTGAACAVVLVCSMMPTAAFSAPGRAWAETHAQAARLELRAQEIDAQAGSFEENEIIVVYRAGAEPSRQVEQGLSVQSASVAGIPDATAEMLSEGSSSNGTGASLLVDVPEDMTVGQAVATAEADPDVLYAQPNFRYRLLDDNLQAAGQDILGENKDAEGADGQASAQELSAQDAPNLPDDPILQVSQNNNTNPNQWWIYSVKADEAWELVHTDQRVSVAILDTGINFEHRDLKDNIDTAHAYDAYNDKPLTESPDNSEMDHGSHVAGIVAAEADNGFGIAGVSYNAMILPICVFHLQYSQYYGYEVATCSDEDLIRAYDYLLSDADGDGQTIAQETNTRVVNMSLGGYLADDYESVYDQAFEDKIAEAEDAGILTVAAAGNGEGGFPRTDPSYPSDFPQVMSVMALATDTTRATWSDYSEYKDISAPGVDIYSAAYMGDGFCWKSGTSMASPLVAGVAALLWAYNPQLTVADVKTALYSTADDLGATGFDNYYGHGRVNALAAVQSLGTASISAPKTTMVRTSSMQLSAASIEDPDEQHVWNWSVVQTDLAEISASGVLTAKAAGTVEVDVVAADNAELAGKKFIEITELEIPGGITASANPSENTIAVSWAPVDGAVSYDVYRSNSQAGPFDTLLAEVAAPAVGAEQVTYIDRSARASVQYYYQVVPVGRLGEEDVRGEASNVAGCYYTDKSTLKASIARGEDLLESTKTSTNGADVSASEYWATSGQRTELNRALRSAYSVYHSGALQQADVDAAVVDLDAAIALFESQRQKGAKGASSSDSGSNASVNPSAPATSDLEQMYRLYNPNSGEHFYTASTTERDYLVSVGWNAEGTAWTAPAATGAAVYRLYNPYAGDHHYTTSAAERDQLRAVGWNYEAIGWYSDNAKGTPVYRVYNPYATGAGSHHYTTSAAERDQLVSIGWRDEGIGWYGTK